MENESNNPMDGLIIQLHWQNVADSSKSLMVCQGGQFATQEEMHQWIQDMLVRFGSECPEGWVPMICNSSSEFFWWAKPIVA